MRLSIPYLCAACLVLGPAFESAPAEAAAGRSNQQEWNRFRGPNGSGISDARDLPIEFGPDQNVRWSLEVPAGRSSPILVGDLLVLTATDATRFLTMAIDADSGEIRWTNEVERQREDGIYRQNDAAAPTPASDGERLFVWFSELGLVALDLEGNEIWRRETARFDNFYGIGASPVPAGDLVLLLADQVAGSFLVALDGATGEEHWRAERSGRIESWTTPVLYPSAEAPRQALVFGSGWLDAYDLVTGELAWSLPGVGQGPVSSPVLAGNRLLAMAPDHGEEAFPTFESLASAVDADEDGRLSRDEFAGVPGFGEHFGWTDRDGNGFLVPGEYEALVEMAESTSYGLVAIDLPDPETRAEPAIAWVQQQSVGYIASPLVLDGVVYMVRDGGIVSSVDLATGEIVRRARSSRSAGENFAPLVAADGKVFIASEGGEVAVLRAAAEWEVLAVNDLGAPISATPLPSADGRLYVRTADRLFAFEHLREGQPRARQ